MKSANINQPYNLHNAAKFWKFKYYTSKFLFKYGKKKGENIEQWPWSQFETHFGDFERTYWKACQNNYDVFIQGLESAKGFKISVFNWPF